MVKPIETMGSAKYTIQGAVQATHGLNFGEGTCGINRYIKKECNAIIFPNYCANTGHQFHRVFTVYFSVFEPQPLLWNGVFPFSDHSNFKVEFVKHCMICFLILAPGKNVAVNSGVG